MLDDGRSMAELMAYIEFLADDLDAICRHAFAKYRGYAAEILVEHDPRAAAACTYAHIAADAERRFAAFHPKVQHLDPRPLGGLKVWRVGEVGADALIRFKKHDEDGYSRNYPTRQARQYDRGDTLPGLPPEAVRLSVGYLLDATSTEFIRTQVARPLARRIDWCAAIVPLGDRRPGEKAWIDVTRQRKF
jgi:hypothetical protein